jgi:hypothetical protein
MPNRYFFLKAIAHPDAPLHPVFETSEDGSLTDLTRLLKLDRDGGCYEATKLDFSGRKIPETEERLRLYVYPQEARVFLLNRRTDYVLVEVDRKEAQRIADAVENHRGNVDLIGSMSGGGYTDGIRTPAGRTIGT